MSVTSNVKPNSGVLNLGRVSLYSVKHKDREKSVYAVGNILEPTGTMLTRPHIPTNDEW